MSRSNKNLGSKNTNIQRNLPRQKISFVLRDYTAKDVTYHRKGINSMAVVNSSNSGNVLKEGRVAIFSASRDACIKLWDVSYA